jgi:hypothetical protein
MNYMKSVVIKKLPKGSDEAVEFKKTKICGSFLFAREEWRQNSLRNTKYEHKTFRLECR